MTLVAIKSLEENLDISRWVEEGLLIHQSHKSTKCEFCDQRLPADRIQQLANHFNEADKELKKKIDTQVQNLERISSVLREFIVREVSNVYDEFQSEYLQQLELLSFTRKKLVEEIDLLSGKLIEKKSKTTETMSMDVEVHITSFVEVLSAINDLIDKHNRKSLNFEKEKDDARIRLKEHYFSEIFDDVKAFNADIELQKTNIIAIDHGDIHLSKEKSISALEERIEINRSKISSPHKACAQINENLQRFLGRNEIVFEVVGNGYIIKRYGEIAEDLSEGEKTAIAFVYFTVQLSDQDFILKDGIVVVDDPVSSLDANSLFQAFGFLKESIKDAKQVFILTHNFEFMRQVKNWFFHIKKIDGKFQRSFYMIKNREVGGKRTAYLAPLDKLLMEYESEYHYLFCLLQNFKDDGTLESMYNFPNIGRKFLETFLAFKIPSSENFYQKMSHIEYDEATKTTILRFVETHSHAERSDGVLNFDMTLSKGGQSIISDLLAMIKHVDSIHYETLLEATIQK
ncbi:MAG: AAA family ATPase [Actinomycetota bacterium]